MSRLICVDSVGFLLYIVCRLPFEITKVSISTKVEQKRNRSLFCEATFAIVSSSLANIDIKVAQFDGLFGLPLA